MQIDHFLNEFHLFVERQVHTRKNLRHHVCTNGIVRIEGPTDTFYKSFCLQLADIVKQCRPAQPEVIAFFGHIVHHLNGMQENILVGKSFLHRHARKLIQLGENDFEQTSFEQKF